MERTLALLRPETLATAGCLEHILGRIVNGGFGIVQGRYCCPPRQMVEDYYITHSSQSYFGQLIDGLTDQAVFILVLERKEAIANWRWRMGSFREGERDPETIRGIYMRPGDPLHRNFVHGSDTTFNAQREIRIWFPNL